MIQGSESNCEFTRIIIWLPGDDHEKDKQIYLRVSDLVEEDTKNFGKITFTCYHPTNTGWEKREVECYGRCVIKEKNASE